MINSDESSIYKHDATDNRAINGIIPHIDIDNRHRLSTNNVQLSPVPIATSLKIEKVNFNKCIVV